MCHAVREARSVGDLKWSRPAVKTSDPISESEKVLERWLEVSHGTS